MVAQLLKPPLHILICGVFCNVVYQQCAHSPSVVCAGDGPVPLLSRCAFRSKITTDAIDVPYLLPPLQLSIAQSTEKAHRLYVMIMYYVSLTSQLEFDRRTCVPNLSLNGLALVLDAACGKLDADGRLGL